MSAQVSIDGFRLIADRTGCYVPSKEPTYTFDADKNLESATAYIKKLVAGTWHEVSATAFYDEYVQTTKDGKPNSMWRKMPRLMLAKCAETLVLRKAFPAELSGLYTPEEMGTAEIPPDNGYQPQPTDPKLPTRIEIIAPILSDLNKEGDSIKWTNSTLLEFAETCFNAPVASLDALSAADFDFLNSDLKERLKDLRAPQTDAQTDAIDVKIVEDTEDTNGY